MINLFGKTMLRGTDFKVFEKQGPDDLISCPVHHLDQIFDKEGCKCESCLVPKVYIGCT